jgi:aconitate decarboxylase
VIELAPASAHLVAHVAQTQFNEFSAPAIAAAQTFILDSFGVAMAGTRGAFVGELIQTIAAQGRGDEADVWFSGVKLPAASAALVNAYLIHNQEFDCVHEPAVVHPMAVILASLCAYAQIF